MSSPVSVIIPAYNGSSLIGGALESILAQTLPPQEVIVVDDYSTDETLDIVESIARTAPFTIRTVPLPKNSGGPALPLNVGIEQASGDFISVLEQDDRMRPQRIEKQLGAVLNYPGCSLAIARFSFLGSDDGDVSRMWPVPQFDGVADDVDKEADIFTLDPSTAFAVLLTRNFSGSNSNFCFSRQSWKRLGGFNEKLQTCTDLDFMLKAVMSAPVVVVNEVLVDFSLRANSLHRRNIVKSLTEATMVRLRAASKKPEWAVDELSELRRSALILANEAIKNRDFSGVRAIIEILLKYKGLHEVMESINNKTRRLMGLPPSVKRPLD